MRELTTMEMEQVGGGWAFLGPMLAGLSPTVMKVGAGAAAGGAAALGAYMYSMAEWGMGIMDRTCEAGGRASLTIGPFSASCDRTQTRRKAGEENAQPTDNQP